MQLPNSSSLQSSIPTSRCETLDPWPQGEQEKARRDDHAQQEEKEMKKFSKRYNKQGRRERNRGKRRLWLTCVDVRGREKGQ